MNPNGSFQPPRNSSTNTPEPTIMWQYSATKNSDHFFGFLFGACKARVALAPVNAPFT